jgi:hypothetical protein
MDNAFDITADITADIAANMAAAIAYNITFDITFDIAFDIDIDIAFDIADITFDISDMGALSTFTFSGDDNSSKPVTMETTMTEANFSGKQLGVSGGMMVAAFLPKCQ